MALSRRDWLILGGIGATTVVAGVALAPLLLRQQPSASALLAASLPDLSGRIRHLSEWRGEVVLCNFWATWCAPCRKEIPMLVSLRDEFEPLGFEVVGIAVDNASKVREFARTYRVSYPVMIAEASGIDLMKTLGNTAGGLPFTVLLDRDGMIRSRKLGILQSEDINRKIKDLLSKENS
jgi:thiol-disulfide isomerase/thioredoxin